MREGASAVTLQRAEQRIGVDLIARAGQHAAAVIAGEVVTQGGERADVEDGSAGRASVHDGIPHLDYRSSKVVDRAAIIGGSRVAAKGAVLQYQRLTAIKIQDAAAAYAGGNGVATDSAVGYSRGPVKAEAAAAVVPATGRVITDGAVEQR
ncbi:MAG: hypothetical protein DME87_12235 [Verrucomicrobia bacterium]|nr:MAG: hypothetical protein DME87_12235 [Verrucomicrobiota bacterium]